MHRPAVRLRIRDRDAVDRGPAIRDLARRDLKSMKTLLRFHEQEFAKGEYLTSACDYKV